MKRYLSLIKFSHTIFALPFALIGFFLATLKHGYTFEWAKLVLVILCMVFARSAAMAFNRYADRKIDADNERTKVREIPAGKIKASSVLTFVIINSIAFCITAYFINRICFFLSPVALLVVLGYSYTKRFTSLAHFVLGLGLSLAPIGAYLAVSAEFNLLPILFSCAVFFWVGGFDIIYALQDEVFDKQHNLFSIPSWLGKRKALVFSMLVHLFVAVIVLLIGVYGNFQWFYLAGAIIFIGLLVYQHTLVKPNDLSKVNLAFFTTNGIASVVFATFVLTDMLLLH